MNFKASIEVKEDLKNIQKLFESEDKDFKNNRSKYKLKKDKDKVVFEIQANDAVALRSTLDSISKILKIYEEMKEIK